LYSHILWWSNKIPYSRSLDVRVHCAVFDYENVKDKLANCLVQLVDLDDPSGQCQEWFPERQGVVSDLALVRAIDFYNILSSNMGVN